MLHFGYALDNELQVRPGELPSGVQTQAFEIAVTRISQRYATLKRMLLQKTPTGASAIQGLNPQWQVRLKDTSDFIAALPSRLVSVANQIARDDAGNAVAQSGISLLWNRWAPEALQVYSDTLKAFEADVQRGFANQAISVMPAVYVKMAVVAKTDPPLVPVVSSSLSALDPDYLAGAGLEMLGVYGLVAVGAVALGGWWLWKKSREHDGIMDAGMPDGY